MKEYAAVFLIGWAAGIDLYLSVAAAGICSRMGWIPLPPGTELLGHPLIIALALLMYAVEFVADKIPFVDSAWDSLHTFIRPAGAAAVGFLAGTEHGPLAQTAFAVATGAVALNMHAVKASSRLAINMSPEPFSNIAASLAEDAAVLGAFWFFIKHPILTFFILLAIVVLSFFVLRMLWRFVLKLFHRPRRPAAVAAESRGAVSGGGVK